MGKTMAALDPAHSDTVKGQLLVWRQMVGLESRPSRNGKDSYTPCISRKCG